MHCKNQHCIGFIRTVTKYHSVFNHLLCQIKTSRFSAAAAKSLQSCPTLRPHRQKPTRLRRPWDSPSKNTGVGCHFLLQCMKVKSESEVAQSCLTLCGPHGLQPTRLPRPWDFPGKSTGVGCHCLLRCEERCVNYLNIGSHSTMYIK